MSVNEKVPLNSRKIAAMKPSKAILADIGENRGLRVTCGNAGTKTFFYRYTSPVNGSWYRSRLAIFQRFL